jgi:hypothetical protein
VMMDARTGSRLDFERFAPQCRMPSSGPRPIRST